MENIAKKKIESFAGLTDVFINEVVPSNNGDGFTHSPQGFKYELFNGSGVISLAGAEDNIRGKLIKISSIIRINLKGGNYNATTMERRRNKVFN